MQTRVIVASIDDYNDSDDHAMYKYILGNKPLKLTVIFDSRTSYPEFKNKKEFEIQIEPIEGKVKLKDIQCIQVKEYLKDKKKECETHHLYRFLDKVHGITILFNGLKEYPDFVKNKWYHFSIKKPERGNQTTIQDHVNQEAAGAKS
jgi:hypothetical protein